MDLIELLLIERGLEQRPAGFAPAGSPGPAQAPVLFMRRSQRLRVARTAVTAVDALRLAHVQRFKRPFQTALGPRHCDQMDVIGHQAKGQNLNVIFAAVLTQPIQIGMTIFIAKEHQVATLAALHNVTWELGVYAVG